MDWLYDFAFGCTTFTVCKVYFCRMHNFLQYDFAFGYKSHISQMIPVSTKDSIFCKGKSSSVQYCSIKCVTHQRVLSPTLGAFEEQERNKIKKIAVQGWEWYLLQLCYNPGTTLLQLWYTPYQYEDPSPAIPTYRKTKRKGKIVEDYSRDRAA